MTRLDRIEQRLDQLIAQYEQNQYNSIYRLKITLLMAERRALINQQVEQSRIDS